MLYTLLEKIGPSRGAMLATSLAQNLLIQLFYEEFKLEAETYESLDKSLREYRKWARLIKEIDVTKPNTWGDGVLQLLEKWLEGKAKPYDTKAYEDPIFEYMKAQGYHILSSSSAYHGIFCEVEHHFRESKKPFNVVMRYVPEGLTDKEIARFAGDNCEIFNLCCYEMEVPCDIDFEYILRSRYYDKSALKGLEAFYHEHGVLYKKGDVIYLYSYMWRQNEEIQFCSFLPRVWFRNEENRMYLEPRATQHFFAMLAALGGELWNKYGGSIYATLADGNSTRSDEPHSYSSSWKYYPSSFPKKAYIDDGSFEPFLEEWRELSHKGEKGVVLLQGEPGCGKSTFVRHVARELGLTFMQVQLDSFPRMDLSWESIRTALNPGMLIVDDVDRLSSLVVDDLLVFLERSNLPLVFMTTNNYMKLSEAFRRSGRVDYVLKFQKPSAEVIDALCKEFMSRMGIDLPEDPEKLLILRDIYTHYQGAGVEGYLKRIKLLGWEYSLRENDVTFEKIFMDSDELEQLGSLRHDEVFRTPRKEPSSLDNLLDDGIKDPRPSVTFEELQENLKNFKEKKRGSLIEGELREGGKTK